MTVKDDAGQHRRLVEDDREADARTGLRVDGVVERPVVDSRHLERGSRRERLLPRRPNPLGHGRTATFDCCMLGTRDVMFVIICGSLDT